jgi:DUF971 family protein
MSASTTPSRLDLQKDRQLIIEWQDGGRSVYPVAYLREMCPCAQCKIDRKERESKKARLSLRILSGDSAAPIAATGAELVGNYAIRLDWSDNHGSGIYSFDYLRSIDPTAPASGSRQG